MYRLTVTTLLLLILNDRWILIFVTVCCTCYVHDLIDTCWARTCFDSFVFIDLWIGNATACFIICYGLPLIVNDELRKYDVIMIHYGSYSHDNENEFGGSHVKILFLTSMEAASAARSLVGTKTCCFRQWPVHSTNQQVVTKHSRKTPNQWPVFLFVLTNNKSSVILVAIHRCFFLLRCNLKEQVW